MVLPKLSFQVLVKSSNLPACSEKVFFFPILLYLDAKHVVLLHLQFPGVKKTNILKTTFLKELLSELCINKHLNYGSCHVEKIRFH